MKFRDHKYTCNVRFGRINHSWSLRGPDGGINFHFSEWCGPDADKKNAEFGGPTAGLEVHRYQPAEYQRGEAASQTSCWLLGAPCWHDGTSMYATDTLLPIIQSMMPDHPAILTLLEREYEQFFEGEE